MLNKKLMIIVICFLLILGSVLFFYGLKDMFAGKSSGIEHNLYKNENSDEPVISDSKNDAEGDNDPEQINNAESQNDISPVEENYESMEGTTTNQTENNTDTSGETVSQPINDKDNKEETNNSEKQNDKEKEPQNNNSSETNVTDGQETGNTINILLLGIDRTADREESSISFSSDAIMLARIDMTHNKADILSIPRDSYVHIPIIDKKDKIAYSYSYGYIKGKEVKSTIETINSLAGKPVVDYYFAMDMGPIPGIVDELGGIEINVGTDMIGPSGVSIPKGPQLLNGENILDYIRWRNSGDGDIGRIKRHHTILRAIFDKIASYDIKKLVELFAANEQYIDTDMGIEQIVNLANMISGFKNEDIKFSILPGKPQTIDNISYWIIDEDEAGKLIGGI